MRRQRGGLHRDHPEEPNARLFGRLLQSRLRIHFQAAVARGLGELRALLFIVLEENQACLRLRSWLGRIKELVVRLALQGLRSEVTMHELPSLPQCIVSIQQFVAVKHEQFLAVRALRQLQREDLQSHRPEQHIQLRDQDRPRGERQVVAEPTFDWAELASVLTALMQHAFLRSYDVYEPLMQRPHGDQREAIAGHFGDNFTQALRRQDSMHPLHGFSSWFSIVERANDHPSDTTLDRLLNDFRHRDCAVDPHLHRAKLDAFTGRHDRKKEKALAERKLAAIRAKMKGSGATRSMEKEKQRLTNDLKLISTEDKLLEYTYNKCVEYERKTGRASRSTLTTLFVSDPKSRKSMPPYPEGMGPPPRWVLDTPASSRQKAVQQFVSARQAAFTNINRGNVTHFRMSFRSRRDVNHFTFTEDARNTHLHNEIHEHHHKWKVEPDLVFGTKPHTVNKFLSITSLTNIPVRVSSDAVVDGAVNIFVRHGYFYAAIPYVARPPGLSPTCGCIACDPGLKAFLTCMHFSYIGRANWAKLDRPKQRLRDAQRCMSQFGNIKTVFRRRYNWSEGRRFVAARREFYCVSAKIKYWVDNLHYQAAAYLCKRADVILLPKFDTQSMVRESRPWSHQFNSHLATLSHYRFRRRLLDKCNLLCKSLVLCSEMYTSRTCGSCNRLHVTLRNEDVFACPHCNFRAGRDENAAFNIMRFVWGGSLSIFETTGVASRQV